MPPKGTRGKKGKGKAVPSQEPEPLSLLLVFFLSGDNARPNVPVRHWNSDNSSTPHTRVLESGVDGNILIEPILSKNRTDYIRALSYPLDSYNISDGPFSYPCNISIPIESKCIEMDYRRDRVCENWPINGLSKQVNRDKLNVTRSKSINEHKHQRLKQSVSLDQSGRVSKSGSKGAKRCASEKIRKSSKYHCEGLSKPKHEHAGNVYRDEKEHVDLPFVNENDFRESHGNSFSSDQEQKQSRGKSSANSSLKSYKDSKSNFSDGSFSAKQHLSESKNSKVISQDSSVANKRNKRSDTNSSVSPETSSNELPISKKRKTRSKRKEIQKTKPTFYGLSGTGSDLSYPSANLVSNGKDGDKIRRSKTHRSNIPSNFAVFETGIATTNQHRDVTLFRRKNCCLLSILSAVCLILAAVVTTLLILFLFSAESSADNGFDMTRAHIRLKILNRVYNDSMGNHSDVAFIAVSEPFCKEIDYLFLTSTLHGEYFGCTVKQISSGSVRLYYNTPFLNSDQVRNVTNIKAIITGRDINVIEKRRVTDETVYVGGFLVDIDSISIVLESYKLQQLPKRPRLIMKDLTPTSAISEATTTVTTRIFQSLRTMFPESTSTITPPSMNTGLSTEERVSSTSTTVNDKTTRLTTATSKISVTTPLRGTTPHSGSKHVAATESWLATSTKGFDFEIGSTTTDEIVLPNIHMTSAETYLSDKPTYLKCTVRGLKVYSGQISVYFQQTSQAEKKILLTLINKGNVYASVFQNTEENLSIYHKTVEYDVTIGLRFRQVRCTDVGLYTCELKSRGHEYDAIGTLKGFAMPDKPLLTTPTSLIEGQEILHPITCTANVGFPPGNLRFEIKPRGHTRFIPLQEGHYVTSGSCDTTKTISLMYTPTREANGTLLKCVVENKHVPSFQDLSSVIELKVISANICDGKGKQKTLRHPFECNKYLICHGKYFEIRECDNGVCYDQEAEQCGQTSLNMVDVIAYLKEGVASLKCHLTHTGSWNQITISKIDPSNGTKRQIVTAVRGKEPIIHNTTMKNRVFANIEIETQFELNLNVWVYVLTCDDQGEYECSVDAPFTVPAAKGKIDIRVKPSAPSLSIPNEIIEGLPTRYNITCVADVGYPHGELFLKIKLHNSTDFQGLPFPDELIEEENNCSKVVSRTFQFIPSMEHNGMIFMCEVQNPATLPEGHSMVTSQTIHVVPGNFCKRHNDSTPHVHPYDCHQYVQCSENYIYVQRCGSDFCFNPESLRCDRPDLRDKPASDPNYPCRPYENGVFFHHPFLCNKYIWCVQGEEIVQHCPIGTLYIDSGQCTFDADQSRCYKTKDLSSVS